MHSHSCLCFLCYTPSPTVRIIVVYHNFWFYSSFVLTFAHLQETLKKVLLTEMLERALMKILMILAIQVINILGKSLSAYFCLIHDYSLSLHSVFYIFFASCFHLLQVSRMLQMLEEKRIQQTTSSLRPCVLSRMLYLIMEIHHTTTSRLQPHLLMRRRRVKWLMMRLWQSGCGRIWLGRRIWRWQGIRYNFEIH